jgi:hypothetical protein
MFPSFPTPKPKGTPAIDRQIKTGKSVGLKLNSSKGIMETELVDI